ncbi:hypothetical protein B0G69_7933 [Paraburkholderia sp. RAU2J]|nr:hypothetical protein B0G69_7933 [Paraburkholderia sp. RAU2J]
MKIAIVGLDLADTKSLISESMKMPNPRLAKVLKRLHYPLEVIPTCVRWYVAYPLSLRHLEEMMAERGIEVDRWRSTGMLAGSTTWHSMCRGLQRATDPERVLPGLIAHDDPYVSSAKNFKVRSAIRHYLLVLMTVGRPQRASGSGEMIAGRVVEIVRLIGFGPRDAGIFLFDSVLYGDEFDLWTVFCSYTNLFSDDLYISHRLSVVLGIL